jgi:hypothetical protein
MRYRRSTALSLVGVLAFILSGHVIAVGRSSDNGQTSKIHGKWKSDVSKTMEFNERYSKLEQEQIIALRQIFGKNTLIFSGSQCEIHVPAYTLKREGKDIVVDESVDRFPVTVLSETDDAIVVKTTVHQNDHTDAVFSIWHVEGEYLWTYVGDMTTGLHLREYFVRE